jgi:hypothetical protein
MELILSNVEPKHKRLFSEMARALNVGIKELNTNENNNKEQKLSNRLKAIQQTEPFFKSVRNGLPNDYKFDREFANER